MKKFLMAAIVGLIICAGMKVEAADIYVGMSPATGYECYVMTNTISRKNEARMVITSATLKMIDQYGGAHYLDYKFFDLDGDAVDVDLAFRARRRRKIRRLNGQCIQSQETIKFRGMRDKISLVPCLVMERDFYGRKNFARRLPHFR